MSKVHLQRNRPQIWAIGGGKGGVGKSIVSILLSLALARSNQKTVLIDLDLGSANLHTMMGIKTPSRTLNDFITRKYENLEDACIRTHVSNLEMICGASEILSMANPQFAQKNKIIQSIFAIRADHVVLDLGAGTSFNVLDFFIIADSPIVVHTPQPISIQNAYGFIRNAMFRKLSRITSRHPALQEIIKEAMNPQNELSIRTMSDLRKQVCKDHGERIASQLIAAVARIRPILITNMVKNERDGNASKIIQLVAEKYLMVNAQGIGIIEYDLLIEELISKMKPISDLPKYCRSCVNTETFVQKLAPNTHLH